VKRRTCLLRVLGIENSTPADLTNSGREGARGGGQIGRVTFALSARKFRLDEWAPTFRRTTNVSKLIFAREAFTFLLRPCRSIYVLTFRQRVA